jgi:hypothetical protein
LNFGGKKVPQKFSSLLLLATFLVAPQASAQVTPPDSTQGQPTRWEALTGVDYFVGKYGAASDTTMTSVPLNVRVQMDRLRLEFAASYLDVKGPGVFAGGGIVVPGSSQVTRRSGFGDVNLGAAWLFNRGDQSSPSLELAGTVKLPTAGTGLGTKKFDYTAQVNIYQTISPSFTLLGSAGYQWLGDFGTIKLEDGLVATAGMNFKPAESTSVGAIISYRQEYFHGLGDQFSLSPYFVWNFSGTWRVSGYGLIGLTDASPRLGGGLRVGLYQ